MSVCGCAEPETANPRRGIRVSSRWGGMGEVYRARDTKLNRDVALKVLPDSFASDPDRLGRFKREAQVLASLNHSSIAEIYGFEDSGANRRQLQWFDRSRPTVLFQTRIYGGGSDNGQGWQYDVSRDGRFLINTVLDESASAITILQNWRPPTN